MNRMALIKRLAPLVFAILPYVLPPLVRPPTICAQQTTSSGADGGLSEDEKSNIRKGWKRNPQQGEQLIIVLEAHRKEAAEYRRNPTKMRDDLMGIVRRLEQHNKNGDAKFLEVWTELEKKMQFFDEPEAGQRLPMPSDTGNLLAENLIDIFNKRRSYTSRAGTLDIKIAAQYGNSRKVKDHLIAALNGADEEKKKRALDGLAWSKTLKGDRDIYDALERKVKGSASQDLDSLSAMITIDQERALPEVLGLVDSTQNIARFNRGASMICRYHRTDLLEHVLVRLHAIPQAQKGPQRLLNNPTLGIEPQLLLDYISEAEGAKLRPALDALEMTAGALSKSYPILKGKLASKDRDTRSHTLDSLGRLFRRGIFVNEEARKDLQQHLQKESEPELRQKAEKAVEVLRSQAKSRP